MPLSLSFRIAAVIAAVTLLSAAATSSAVEPKSPTGPFDFKVSFDNLPDGSPFQLPQQQQVFNDPHIVKHINGDTGRNVSKYVMSIVSHDCKNAHCLQYTYPKGSRGTFLELPGYGSSGFVLVMSQADILNIEFDWLFEPGFDLDSGIGKIPGWLMIGSGSLNKGTQELLTWRANYHPTRLAFLNQDPETGHTCCGSAGVGPAAVTGHWYHVRMQIKAGRNGYSNGWIDGKPVFHNGPFHAKTQLDTAIVNFRTWFGGANHAANDSYAHMDNIHIWSGSGP
jgi:hypothetical protein